MNHSKLSPQSLHGAQVQMDNSSKKFIKSFEEKTEEKNVQYTHGTF